MVSNILVLNLLHLYLFVFMVLPWANNKNDTKKAGDKLHLHIFLTNLYFHIVLSFLNSIETLYVCYCILFFVHHIK